MRLEKRRVILFVAITFLLSWGLAAYPWFGGMTQDSLNQPAALLLGGYMWMPALASLLTRLLTCQGFSGLGLRPHIRGKGKYYWWGWSLPVGFSLAGVAVYFALFPGRFALNLQFPQLEGSTLLAVLLAGRMVLVVPVNVFTGVIGEELGWRGYLFPQLCKLTTPGWAAVISGLIWGVWHTPLICMGWDYGLDYPGYPWAGVAVLTLCCVAMSAWTGWLTCRAGCIWPATLFHSGINVLYSIFLLEGNFCGQAYCPLLGAHPLTLIGGWLLLVSGGWILLKSAHLFAGR